MSEFVSNYFSKDECEKCGSSKDLEEHHIYPKSYGGTNADGLMWLCKKCHVDWHCFLRHYKTKNKELITYITLKWINMNDDDMISPVCFCGNSTRIEKVNALNVTMSCSKCGESFDSDIGLLRFFFNKIKELEK